MVFLETFLMEIILGIYVISYGNLQYHFRWLNVTPLHNTPGIEPYLPIYKNE